MPRGTFLHAVPHLAMLHSGSMLCTWGSPMYSNFRLLFTRARSTLTKTGTQLCPLDDGGETHMISFIDRLVGRQQEGCEERQGQLGCPLLEKGFVRGGGQDVVLVPCPVYYRALPLSASSFPETQLWLE